MVRLTLALLACAVGSGAGGCTTSGQNGLRIRTEASSPASFDNLTAREIEIDINTLLEAALCAPLSEQFAEAPRRTVTTTTRENGTRVVHTVDPAAGTEKTETFAPGSRNPIHSRTVELAPDEEIRARERLDVCSGNYAGEPTDRYLRLSEQLRDHPERNSIRNQALTQLVGASNANCSVYLLSLRGTQVGSRLTFDATATTAGLAGTLTNHAPTTQIWSAIAAWATATGVSVDRAVFAESGMEIIANQIQRLRDRRRAELEGKLTTPYDLYPIGLALGDIALYHQDCSIMRGLTEMQAAVQSREDAIRLARQTAMRVSEQDGNGRQVAAAVAGVIEVYLGLDEPDGQTPAVVSTHLLRNAPDLQARRTRAVQHLRDEITSANIDNKIKLLGGDIKCASVDTMTSPGWESNIRFAGWRSLCASKSAAATAAQAITPEAAAASGISREAAAMAAAAAIYRTARSDAITAIDRAVEENIARRVAAGDYLRSLARIGARFETVEEGINSLQAGAGGDPIFEILDAGANSVKAHDDGALAANVAIAAANAYLASYTEQRDPGLRPGTSTSSSPESANDPGQ